MRRVDNEHVGPLNQSLQHLLGARRFQIERHAALIAIGQVPGISVAGLRLRRDLVPYSPQVAIRRLHFDDVGAEVGQDHGGTGTGDETGQVYDFQSGEYIVVCHWVLPKRYQRRNPQRPWNWGARFSRKAAVPSLLSSVEAQRPK